MSAWSVPSSASAQDGPLDPQIFLPTVAPGTTFTIERAGVLPHKAFVLGLHENVAVRPFVRDDANVVPFRSQTEALFGIGLFHVMQLDLAMPVVVQRVADDPLGPTSPASTVVRAGDMRLALKVPFLKGDRPFHLAGRFLVSVPTGDDGRLTGYGSWTATPSLIFGYDHGRLSLGGDLGYRFRRRDALGGLEQDDEITASIGAQIRAAEVVAVLVETQARIGVAGRRVQRQEVPMEIDAGLRFFLGSGMTLDVGAGTRMVRGYGAPVARAFATFRYVHEGGSCTLGPEDRDGFQDGDFCADPDNDADGIDDERDECRNDAEDEDGFLDADGCPDTDNDADGLADAADRCPLETEDTDAFEDEDGCPEPDNDQDGLADGLDRCPMQPEDLDAFEDEDGCPEPGPDTNAVVMIDTRILISERVFFEYDSAEMRSVNAPLLDQVAASFLRLPEDRRLRIEGYSDAEGDDAYNFDLSYRRARNVLEYLVARGIPRERLVYVGYGEQRPIAPNDAPEGRAINRRVEFTVLMPGESPGAAHPPEGATRGPRSSTRRPRRAAPP
jgi:outer membrane protein OmpA-like peptidoglycan-associated protein